MENRISELQNTNKILEQEAELLYSEMDSAKDTANASITKVLQDLTGIPEITVTTSPDRTVVGVPKPTGGWSNEISIYHYEDYGKTERRFELSWFASSASVATDSVNSGYLKYLTALGRIAELLSSGTTIQDAVEAANATTIPIKQKLSKTELAISKNTSEINQIKREIEKNKILELVSGPVNHFSVVGNHQYENRGKFTKPAETSSQCWELSSRNTVFFDALTVIKNKKNWKVIFHEFSWKYISNNHEKQYYDLSVCSVKTMKEDAIIEMLRYLMPGIKAANLETA